MDELLLPGSMGTSASLSLRLGQTIFSSASLLFMSLGVEFYSYTAFWDVNIQPLFSWWIHQCFRPREHFLVDQQVLCFLFYNISRPSFLVTIMGLVIPWSFTLALVDGFSVLAGCPLRQPGILLTIVIGDWVLSILSLAAACASAGVINFLLLDGLHCVPKFCSRYQLSTAMAFLSWFLSAASSLFNLWLLPSL